MRFRNFKIREKQPKVIPTLEKDIQADIVAYLKLRDIPVSVTDSSRVWGKGGGVRRSKVDTSHPDLSAVLPVVIQDTGGNHVPIGLAFFIEVKTKTGAIKEGQKEMLLRLADKGALCILARDVESVVRVVNRFMNKPFDMSAYTEEILLLKLNLSDRRSKEVRDALKEFGKESPQPAKSLKQ